MSTPLIGAPIGPDTPRPEESHEFDHVPRLRELLPNGGWPGVVYAQACIHNIKNAADRVEQPANMRPIRGAKYYAIRGPTGVVAMALVGTGTPIPGASPDGGERLFFTDGEVTPLTGHPVKYPIWFSPQPEENPRAQVQIPPRPDRPSQGRKGHEGVQTGDPA